jgi:hypothetical protein
VHPYLVEIAGSSAYFSLFLSIYYKGEKEVGNINPSGRNENKKCNMGYTISTFLGDSDVCKQNKLGNVRTASQF